MQYIIDFNLFYLQKAMKIRGISRVWQDISLMFVGFKKIYRVGYMADIYIYGTTFHSTGY